MEKDQAIHDVAKELGVTVSGNDFAVKRKLLEERINELLLSDFSKLITVLYRMDVSENKLKRLLKDNPDRDAGVIIADLIIERQEEKIKSRSSFKPPPRTGDDESW